MRSVRVNDFKKSLAGASEGELNAKLNEERSNLYKLRQRLALKQQDNPLAVRLTRKNIARLQTALRQQEIKAGKK